MADLVECAKAGVFPELGGIGKRRKYETLGLGLVDRDDEAFSQWTNSPTTPPASEYLNFEDTLHEHPEYQFRKNKQQKQTTTLKDASDFKLIDLSPLINTQPFPAA